MEASRLDTLAAQVVAWHNRHPLARRITAAQVQSMGFVLLPGMQVWSPPAAPAVEETAALPVLTEVALPDADEAAGEAAAAVEPGPLVAVTATVSVEPDAPLSAEASEELDDLLSALDTPPDPASTASEAGSAPVAEALPAIEQPDAEASAAPTDLESVAEPIGAAELAAEAAEAADSADGAKTLPADEPVAAVEVAVAVTVDEAVEEGVEQAGEQAIEHAIEQAVDEATDKVAEKATDEPAVDSKAEPAASPTADAAAAQSAEIGSSASTPVPSPAPSLRERLTARPQEALPLAAAAASLRARLMPGSASMPVSATVQAQPGGDPARPLLPLGSEQLSQPIRAVFSERFLEEGDLARIAKWVEAQAAVLAVPLPAGALVRRVPRDAKLSAARPHLAERPVDLLLRTATLGSGSRQRRLLVGPGADPAVLGRRMWSPARVALACLPLLAVPATAFTAWQWGASTASKAQQVAAAALEAGAKPSARGASAAVASAASSASSASAPADLQAPAASAPQQTAALPFQAASSAFAAFADQATSSAFDAAHAKLRAAAEAEPDDVEPELGRVVLPPVGPLFTDPRLEPARDRRLAQRAARLGESSAASVATAASQAGSRPGAGAGPKAEEKDTATAATPVNSATEKATGSAPAAPAVGGFALTTRLLRTSAEAEQMEAAIGALLNLAGDGTSRVQKLPVGDDWRVVGGPFTSRVGAEKSRNLLMARGVRTEVMELPLTAVVAAAPAGPAKR